MSLSLERVGPALELSGEEARELDSLPPFFKKFLCVAATQIDTLGRQVAGLRQEMVQKEQDFSREMYGMAQEVEEVKQKLLQQTNRADTAEEKLAAQMAETQHLRQQVSALKTQSNDQKAQLAVMEATCRDVKTDQQRLREQNDTLKIHLEKAVGDMTELMLQNRRLMRSSSESGCCSKQPAGRLDP